MSVDYDRLRALARIVENNAHYDSAEVYAAGDALKRVSMDTTRELLRVHDGVESIRDRCASLAKSARSAGLHVLANEMYANVDTLTELLEGDKE